MNLLPLNILLADDDPDDRLFFDRALKELPVSSMLTVVHDGDQLMNYLVANPENLPHVIFLDINMPCKNGIECLTEIKQNETWKHLPVVMISTSYSRDTINQLFKLGAHVYIRKPEDFPQLKQVIQHALPMASEKTSSSKQLKYILNA